MRNGVVNLSGTVELCAYKEEAEKKAQQNKSAAAIHNEIKVAGPRVPDQELRGSSSRRCNTIAWVMARRRSTRSVSQFAME